jgi:hypothetical protein
MPRIVWTVPCSPDPQPAPAPIYSGGLRIPAGYVECPVPDDAAKGSRAAWTNGKRVIVTGEPGNGDENDPEYEAHNCDAMGCGWDHVLEIRDLDAPAGTAQ